MSANKNLLAINFGGIGDEILFLPTLRTIRSCDPDCKITVLLEPRSKSFSQLTDLVDETITFDIKKKPLLPQDLFKLLMLIRSGKFDTIVSSGSSMMVSMLLFLSGAKQRIGYNSNSLAPLLLTKAVPLDRTVYAGQMYHSLAQGLKENCSTSNTEPTNGKLFHPVIQTREDSLASMKSFLEEKGIDDRAVSAEKRKYHLVLIHPGTSKLATVKGIFKTWPSKNWAELIQLIQKQAYSLPVKIVLAGGPDDKDIIDEIEKEIESLNVVSAFGATKSLNDLAALISLSDLFVCVDSAPMHVAVGLEKPLVALFGPTTPHLLLPPDSIFSYVWDNNNGQDDRHMFDRKGVNLSPQTVFDTIKKKIS